jgi:hypothetical protein
MLVREEGTSIDANDEQPKKAPLAIVVTEEGIWNSINVNDEQLRKAISPMFVTEEGISIDLSDEQ